jgi:hypothetical protein
MKLHHLGIACIDIHEILVSLRHNYNVLKATEILFDENQQVSISMVYIENGVPFELISGEKVKPFIKRNSFIYHMCYEVADLNPKRRYYSKADPLHFSTHQSV